MNEFTEYKLRALGDWLLKKRYSDEYYETNLLKVAISVEDATNTLNMSKRVPRAIKNIIWEMSQEHGQSLDYDKKDLEEFSDIYRDQILSYIPNDLEPGDKAQSIQWLTSLGSNDKFFARRTLLGALQDIELTRGSLAYKIKTNLDSKEEEKYRLSPFQLNLYRDSVVIQKKLESFFNWKQFMPVKDLNGIKSLHEFYEITEEARKAISKYEQEREYANAAKGTESLALRESAADMLSPEYNAYIAHNKGAACDLGRGTEWCTAAPGADWHKGYYSPEDPIFIIEEKNNNRMAREAPEGISEAAWDTQRREKDIRYQVHFGTMQFKDVLDNEVAAPARETLVNMLADFGSGKYLSSQLYDSYLNFKKTIQDPASTAFVDLHANLDSYMNKVMAQKLEEGVEEPDTWIPSYIIGEVDKQIRSGYLIEDDSETSDLAAQMMARYSPPRFFELSLDVDYPELAENIVKKSLQVAGQMSTDLAAEDKWAKEVEPLDLYQGFVSGSLFESDSVDDFFKRSEESRRQLADAVIGQNGLKILLSKETMAPKATAILEEYYPTLRSDIAETIHVKEVEDNSHPFSIRSGASLRAINLVALIQSGFYLEFPEKFNKILGDVVTIIKKQKEPRNRTWWGLGATLDAMSETNIVERYWKYYVELLKFGLKTDFDQFSKYNNASFPDDMKAEIHELTVTEEAAYVSSLVSGTDRAVPGWRSGEVDKETLYGIFSAIEGSDLDTLKERTRYKPVVEFYNKVLAILKRKLYENSAASLQSSSVNRTKIELPREILLYIATLLPSLWSIYNLEYKVTVPSEITAKAHRSMRKLEQEISLRRQDEPQEDSEDSEDDWDDDEDEF